MKNIFLWILGVAVLLVGGFFAFNSYIYNEKQAYAAADYKNGEYIVEGTRVRLVDGKAEVEIVPGSASTVTTMYFGNEVKTDLNQDGKEDVVFILTQNQGGSGTFYYVVAALKTDRGYVGSEALLLGDRIAPQTTEVSQNPNHQGVVVVNYAERAPNEPMTAQPSIAKSLWLKLDSASMQLGEVAQNFEGEANPSTMKLDMKKWVWASALYEDGKEILPKKANVFAVEFKTDGTFSASTDCNQMGGSYTVKGEMLTMSNIFSTKMFCEGSQETEFAQLLSNTSTFHFTSKGELILGLKFDSGTVTFR